MLSSDRCNLILNYFGLLFKTLSKGLADLAETVESHGSDLPQILTPNLESVETIFETPETRSSVFHSGMGRALI